MIARRARGNSSQLTIAGISVLLNGRLSNIMEGVMVADMPPMILSLAGSLDQRPIDHQRHVRVSRGPGGVLRRLQESDLQRLRWEVVGHGGQVARRDRLMWEGPGVRVAA